MECRAGSALEEVRVGRDLRVPCDAGHDLSLLWVWLHKCSFTMLQFTNLSLKYSVRMEKHHATSCHTAFAHILCAPCNSACVLSLSLLTSFRLFRCSADLPLLYQAVMAV